MAAATQTTALPLSQGDVSLLLLIVDVHPRTWASSSLPLQLSATPASQSTVLKRAIEHVLVFINAYLALNHDNVLAVIASSVSTSRFLYPRDGASRNVIHLTNSDSYQQFFTVNNTILHTLKEFMLESPTEGDINRFMRRDTAGTLRPRILVISAAPDSSHQYISTMNCIFSSQKLGIPIDVCRVTSTDSIFLQQAAHLTKGSYLRVDQPDALLQQMIFSFLPDRFARLILRPVTIDTVDFRAACFCHKRIIDIGYVCSVCLSIYCETIPVCATCNTAFASIRRVTGQNLSVVGDSANHIANEIPALPINIQRSVI